MSFKTSYKWSIDEKSIAEWVDVSKTSGNAGIFNLAVRVQKNLSNEARDAAFYIKSGDYTYRIKIAQAADDVVVDVYKDPEGNNYVEVSSDPESKAAVAVIPVEEEKGLAADKSTIIEVSGIGTVTFNAAATNAILANAEAEGATNVYFKVEDVTTTKPVPNADVVLELTMKTVDENGVEVYCEGNAAGEVTVEIPLKSDVVYVNDVTLVDDEGNPLTGGVVDGSIVFDEIKHILTFKVKHFSKYAVDYVTKAEFVSVTGVSIELEELGNYVGEETDLTHFVTFTPDNATNKNVTWSSSNTDVATVDSDGLVKSVAFGEAIITVTTEDGGKTATCKVKVSEKKTLAEILATNSGFPESENMLIPANAWVSSADPNCRAFIGVYLNERCFVLMKSVDWLKLELNTPFNKVDDNTYEYVKPVVGTFIIKLTDGKCTSFEYQPDDYYGNTVLAGTYAALPLPDGALKGVFTVNAEGKKVYFSNGNLYYDRNAFKFEDNQYEISMTRANSDRNYYFFWSNNSSEAVANVWDDSYKADPSDILFTNATADTPNPNFVVNGVKGLYRALSDSEFSYLLYNRPDAGKKVGFATVCEKEGIILLPDYFTDPDKNGGSEPFCPKSTDNSWSDNIYDNTGWSAMESAGAVFLPMAGVYYIDKDYPDELDVCYWLSNLTSFDVTQGRVFYFSENGNNGNLSFNVNNIVIWNGYPIRLVIDVAPAGSTIEDFNVKGNDSDNWN